MTIRAFSKYNSRVPWTTAISFAIIIALFFEGLTIVVFYSYLDKETKAIGEQKELLRASEEQNAALRKELSLINGSVSNFFKSISDVDSAIETADKHLNKHTKSSELQNSLLLRAKVQLSALQSENANLKQQLSMSQFRTVDSGAGKRWLTIGIPTVPRKGNPDYLGQTIDSIIAQLPTTPEDPFFGKVMIVVLNNRPGGHSLFEKAKRRLEGSPHAIYFHFEEAFVPDTDELHNPEGNPNVPGSKVRRQTRAVVALMRASAGLAGHFLFMEDDFLLCPHALRALAYVTAKARAYLPGGWSGVRVSYGLCGIILQDSDVLAVASYLEEHQGRRPPDHLLPEWIAAESQQARNYLAGRRNLGFRFNLLRHIGATSSLREAHQVGFPGCYEELAYPVLFEAEAWDAKQPACLADDLWPCGPPAGSGWPSAWLLHGVASKGAQHLDGGAHHHEVAFIPPHS